LNPNKYAAEFLSYSGQYELSPVLSLTCGIAEDEIFLAQHGLSVHAVDSDAQKLQAVCQRILEEKLNNLTVAQADILKPVPFPAHTFNSLYWKFGLHYFSEGQISGVIIPEMVRVLNPNSPVSIIFRYVDITTVDHSRYEITGHKGNEVQFLEKSTGQVRTRYIWDEAAARGLFAERFEIIKSETKKEELFERFSNSINSMIVSMQLSVR
jgi:ubiquinone/menaquinone biosynthesis C-methylase UbiE